MSETGEMTKFFDTFRIQGILSFFLFSDTFHIQGILPLLLFLETCRVHRMGGHCVLKHENDKIICATKRDGQVAPNELLDV